MTRNYSNIAFDTTLSAGIAAGDLTCVVASASGWPAVPFAAVLDPGSLTVEEVVQVTNVAGTTFTITRGFDGTTAAAHSAGATVRHAAIAGDFTDLQAADTTEASTRAAADLLRLLIANYDWSTLPSKPTFGTLALLNSITASLISDASANGQSLITATDYAAMRTLLALVVGTNVQAFHANLAALAGLTLAADRSVYSTGAGALALYTLSAFARTLLDDADAAAVRATIGAAMAVAEGRVSIGGTTHYSIPGIDPFSVNTLAYSANQDRFAPFVVVTPITVDQLACEVTTASGSGGSTARLGIYAADANWQVGALIVDGGAVANDSTGIKTAFVNVTLQPGRYFATLNMSVAATYRVVIGGNRYVGYISTLSASPFIYTLNNARAYAAFPDPGTGINSVLATSVGMRHAVFLRISTP